MERMNGDMSQLLCLDVETSLGDLLNGTELDGASSLSMASISSNWCLIINIVTAFSQRWPIQVKSYA